MSGPQVIDDEEHERVAAVDVAKDSGVVCARTPHPSRPGARQSTVWTVKARMNAIRKLGRQLSKDRIEIVTLESTSDYARARTRLTQERTRCWQRLEKLLEGALVKVSSVASKLTTVSAQDMIKAMIAGQRDPQVLAGLARGRMKARHTTWPRRWTACSMTTTANWPACCWTTSPSSTAGSASSPPGSPRRPR